MGDWSEAMDDGVICKGCALPLGAGSSPLGAGPSDGYCPACSALNKRPPSSESDSALDRARDWKAASGN